MKVIDAGFTKSFIRMCSDGFAMGWHERNGGNLSYRVKEEELASVKDDLDENAVWHDLGTTVPELAGEYFMVTGSGKYFRNVEIDPSANIGLVKLDDSGSQYRIEWGLTGNARPTSEFPTHVMNLEVCKKRDSDIRVVYHCHPTNVIALTFILPLDGKIFTRELWEMATECPVVFPEGIGVIDWMVCGGREIGVKTSEIMAKQDVAIWAHHGVFVCGRNFDESFGLMHTVEKSAEILIKVMSVTNKKRQTITPENFRALKAPFGVDIKEDFLYEKKSGLIGEY